MDRFCLLAGGIFLVPAALAFPCFVIGLLASPLCGAGTYFSLPAAKKSRQKKAALHRQSLSGSPGLELRITHISCGASAILAKYPIHLGDFVKYQKPSPHNGGAGRVIMLAVQIATEFGNPQYDFAERGRGNRWL